MTRFRLFGRPAAAPSPPPPSPPAAPGASGTPGWGEPGSGPPPVGAGAPWPGPATRSAQPFRSGHAGESPPTDPHGFPPVPVPRPEAAGWGPPQPAFPAQPHRAQPAAHPAPPHPGPAHPAPDHVEAAALAGAFAVDYLSWDEDDPGRRGRVLLDYLPSAGSDPARLGWSGRGRQRAEFALPGLVRPDGDGRLLVDVRVRVTPYRSVGDHSAEYVDPVGDDEPDIAGVPAAAPAPTGRGWRSLASYWIRISVPITFDGGRLVVDAWEETLGEEPPPPAGVRPPADDHSLADDDPLVPPHTGSTW